MGEDRELRFDSSGQQLIGVGARGLWSWDLTTDKINYQYKRTDYLERIWSAQILPDRIALSAENKGNLQFLDPATGKLQYSFALPRGYTDISLSSDGRIIAYEALNTVVLADAFSGAKLFSLPVAYGDLPTFSPDGTILVTFDKNWAKIRFWDVSSIRFHAETLPLHTATPAPAPTSTPAAILEPISRLQIPALVPQMAAPNALRPENASQIEPIHEYGLGQIHMPNFPVTQRRPGCRLLPLAQRGCAP
ncbi:MAG: WD40 repeat domain-containing protein [Bacteroidales bacterium]